MNNSPATPPVSVLHWAPQSGTETGTGKAIDAWTEAAAAAGVEVHVVSQNRPPSQGATGGVSYLGGNIQRRELRGAFRRKIREIDIVHLHGAFDPTLSRVMLTVAIEKLGRSLRGRRLGVVLTPHGALSDFVFGKNRLRKTLYWKLLDGWLMKTVDCFICNTPIESDQLKRRLPSAVSATIPLVVDSIGQHEPAKSRQANVTVTIPTLCTIGRYDIGIKGLDLLIQAVVQLNDEGFPVRLRCIGYDRQGGVAELQRYVDLQDAGKHIECSGPKFGTDKQSLLEASSVFCMPSRYESFSYSLMEGLQSGLPVLVGSGACVTSYMNPEQREQLVVEPSIEAWKSAIGRVLAEPGANRACAGSTFRDFSAMCTPGAVGDALCQVYSKLIWRESALPSIR